MEFEIALFVDPVNQTNRVAVRLARHSALSDDRIGLTHVGVDEAVVAEPVGTGAPSVGHGLTRCCEALVGRIALLHFEEQRIANRKSGERLDDLAFEHAVARLIDAEAQNVLEQQRNLNYLVLVCHNGPLVIIVSLAGLL